MKKSGRADKSDRIGDAAVKARTGKNWAQWFAVLDAAGARKMSHSQIATYLYEKQGCAGWWNQMVAVGYERERGLREKYQKPSGYAISVSKTVAVPLGRLYASWQDGKARGRWLPNSAWTIRKATRNKSMRITWADGRTSLEVNFYAKGARKSQVAMQHNKLADAKAAERMKTYWAKALERLKAALET